MVAVEELKTNCASKADETVQVAYMTEWLASLLFFQNGKCNMQQLKTDCASKADETVQVTFMTEWLASFLFFQNGKCNIQQLKTNCASKADETVQVTFMTECLASLLFFQNEYALVKLSSENSEFPLTSEEGMRLQEETDLLIFVLNSK